MPALLLRAVRNSHTAPEYGALQTLRALVCQSGFSLQRHSKNCRENGKLLHICIQRAGLRFEVYGGALRTDAPYLRYVLALFVMVHILPVFLFTSSAAEQNDEHALIHILQSSASPKEKDGACARLKRIGTEQSIPALSALLSDERLSHSARYALESMPFPRAGVALLQGLENTSGLTRISIINSLGVRREPQAVPALEKLLVADRKSLAQRDEDTVVAVAAALGQIATPASVHALESACRDSSGRAHDGIVDGLLQCANRLLAAGDQARALTVFKRIYATEKSETVRIAAYCGMIRSSFGTMTMNCRFCLCSPISRAAGPKDTCRF